LRTGIKTATSALLLTTLTLSPARDLQGLVEEALRNPKRVVQELTPSVKVPVRDSYLSLTPALSKDFYGVKLNYEGDSFHATGTLRVGRDYFKVELKLNLR